MNKLNIFSVLIVLLTIGLTIFGALNKESSHNKISTQTTVSSRDSVSIIPEKPITKTHSDSFTIAQVDSFINIIALRDSLRKIYRMEEEKSGKHHPTKASAPFTVSAEKKSDKYVTVKVKRDITSDVETKAINKGSTVKEGIDSLSDTVTLQNGNTVTTLSKAVPATDDNRKYWTKIIFTAILGIAALWVVLSGRYDPETRKWAFSVLTGIFGVWIGSIT